MDPQETFQEILAALRDHDWELVQDASDALRTWMNRGGFPPATLGADSLGAEWHGAVAAYICDLAPPVPKTGGPNSEPVSEPQVIATAADGGPSVGPTALKIVAESDSKPTASKRQKRKSEAAVEGANGSSDAGTSADFAAALAMIAALPLSDVEKAEAIRRLLNRDA